MSVDGGEFTGTITTLLREARAGRQGAADEVLARVYDDLRRLARKKLAACGKNGSLEGTALVNAACERLLGRDRLDAEDRRHFFFLLGRAMHDVLVEQIRADDSIKRGGAHRRVPLAEFAMPGESRTVGFQDLHTALEELRERDADAAQVVTLRFFAGRTLEETAECMGCTFAVARRHWEYARAWLHERLAEM